jgi:trimeric autotransporter adhesin
MQAFSSLRCSPSAGRSRLSWSNSGFGIFLTALLLVLCPIAASAQNKINTIAGDAASISNPATSDMAGPVAVLEDGSGNVYVSSPQEQWIYEMSGSTGQLSVFAGTGFITDHYKSGPANQDPLWSPMALAIDKQGNIYIADTGNNVIREVNASGIQTVVAGTSKPCLTMTGCGDGGLAVHAKLNGPQGIAVDSNGNLYIADTGDNRVRVVNLTTGIIKAFAGNYSNARCTPSTGTCGDGGPPKSANLNNPIGLAVDAQNHVYIADSSDNRIRLVSNNIITTIAGSGTACFPTTAACGDGGAATSAHLRAPKALSVDGQGNFYIADTGDNRIRLVTAGTTPTISTIAGSGVAGFDGDGTATSVELAGPWGVYVDKAGNVLIADSGNQRVRAVTGTKLNTIIGGAVPNGGDNGVATSATLADPYTVALDSADNYYIADQANNRVRFVNTGTQVITTVAGNGNASYAGDGGVATAANLNSPEGVAVDGSENLYIADTGNAVIRCVAGVAGACVGSKGGVPVGDINTIVGTQHLCSPSTGACGDGGPAYEAWLSSPTSVVLDAAGNLFIVDASANKIREVSGGVITTIAGTGKFGTGTGGGPCTFTINDGDAATSANLCNPHGIAVDSSDNVYIADAGSSRVLCVLGVVGGCGDSAKKYTIGEIIVYAYNGNVNFAQCPKKPVCKAIDAQRWVASELALDSRGNLFVGGGNDYVVQRIDQATGTIVTVAGNDSQYYYYGFYGDGHAAIDAHINALGMAIDSHENLLISDAGNNRVREVSMVAVGTASPKSIAFGDVTVGSTSPPQPVTLTNTGADDLHISNIAASANFNQTNKCAKMLAPSQSCTIQVTFSPAQKQVYKGTLTINHDGYNGQTTVTLSGTGD